MSPPDYSTARNSSSPLEKTLDVERWVARESQSEIHLVREELQREREDRAKEKEKMNQLLGQLAQYKAKYGDL